MDYVAVNVTLDIYSAVFILILIYYLLMPSNRRVHLNRTFATICVSNLAMLIGDIPAWACQGNAYPWFPAAIRAGCLLQYLGGVALPLTYTHYVVTYLSPKVRVSSKAIAAVLMLGAIGGICVLLNLHNGMYYYFDADNMYRRGSLWWLSQFIAVTTLAIDAGIIIRHRRELRKKEIFAFLGYNIWPLTAILIQGLYYGIALTYPASTISIFIIFLSIQSEQALRLEQNKKELAESRISIMLSQIQPHFLYNVLADLRQLCRIDPVQAGEAVGEFAYFLRGNMDALTHKEPIPFEQELKHVKNYLSLEKRRFGDQLKVTYDIQNMDFQIPPLTLQPIVENAVRHGIFGKESGGTITIRTQQTEDAWQVVVTDDGVGFDVSLPLKDDGKSHIGIENVRRRLWDLTGGLLELRSSPGKGAVAVISIPKGGKKT